MNITDFLDYLHKMRGWKLPCRRKSLNGLLS